MTDKKTYNLFLDDVRIPAGAFLYTKKEIYVNLNWVIARDYDEFIAIIKENGLPEVVSFDHDLAAVHYDPSTWSENFVYDEETGYDCAKWMIDYCMDHNQLLPEYYVHSMNPVGHEKILSILDQYKKYEEKNRIQGE